jgi:hypothetical protein
VWRVFSVVCTSGQQVAFLKLVMNLKENPELFVRCRSACSSNLRIFFENLYFLCKYYLFYFILFYFIFYRDLLFVNHIAEISEKFSSLVLENVFSK